MIPDLSELEFPSDDPVGLLLALDAKMRPDIDFVRDFGEAKSVEHYIDLIIHYCNRQDIKIDFEFDLWRALSISEVDADYGKLTLSFFNFKKSIDRLKIEKLINTSKGAENEPSIRLTADWRTRIHNYIELIRKIVDDAGLSTARRESVLGTLNTLSGEVNKERTPIRRFTDSWTELAAGISEGCKELRPAVRLMEKIVGSMRRLQDAPLALPPPDDIALPEPPENDENDD